MADNVSVLIAFGAGLLSFLSPCVLPLIPSYISLLLGEYADQNGKRYIILPALLFITGFSTIFISLGLSASMLGQLLLKNLVILRKTSGIFVIIMGFQLMGIIKLKSFYKEKRLDINGNNKFLRPVFMGFAMALAWTPCIGPILSSILVYAANSQSLIQGGVLLTFYTLGFAIPFLLTAIFFNWLLPGLKKVNPYLPFIQKIAGILLIIIGFLIYTNYIQIFSQL